MRAHALQCHGTHAYAMPRRSSSLRQSSSTTLYTLILTLACCLEPAASPHPFNPCCCCKNALAAHKHEQPGDNEHTAQISILASTANPSCLCQHGAAQTREHNTRHICACASLIAGHVPDVQQHLSQKSHRATAEMHSSWHQNQQSTQRTKTAAGHRNPGATRC